MFVCGVLSVGVPCLPMSSNELSDICMLCGVCAASLCMVDIHVLLYYDINNIVVHPKSESDLCYCTQVCNVFKRGQFSLYEIHTITDNATHTRTQTSLTSVWCLRLESHYVTNKHCAFSECVAFDAFMRSAAAAAAR